MFFKIIAKNLFWGKNLLDDLLREDLKYLYSTPSRFGKQYSTLLRVDFWANTYTLLRVDLCYSVTTLM